MTEQYGILVDYEWCSGCRACEVACQMELKLPAGRFGIKITEIGPWQIEGDRWQDTFIPSFTDECTLCAQRVEKGKLPSCVHHCQAAILKFGSVDELTPHLREKNKQFLVVP